MKKLLSGLLLLNVLVFGVGGVSEAHALDDKRFVSQKDFADHARRVEAINERVNRVHKYEDKIRKLQFNNVQWERRGPTVQIPELDANAAGAALALLIGGALVLVERRKQVAA